LRVQRVFRQPQKKRKQHTLSAIRRINDKVPVELQLTTHA
jgi:hypothetical protein